MGWAEDEANRINQERQRNRALQEAVARKQQEVELLDTQWKALVSQVKHDLKTFETALGWSVGLVFDSPNENNLTIHRPVQPHCKLEIVRDAKTVDARWTDDSGGSQATSYDLIPNAGARASAQMSEGILKPLVGFVRAHFTQ
jgi:hypothetical protein